jgi:hypothetical protein
VDWEILIWTREGNNLKRIITINNNNTFYSVNDKMDVFHPFKRFFTNAYVLCEGK